MKKTAHLIATVLYTGHFPVAPGTVGALTGSLAYFFISNLAGFNLLVTMILIFFTGVWASAISEKDLGHDASEINIDELAGILTTYLFIPRYHLLFITFAGFILFRVDSEMERWDNLAEATTAATGVVVTDLICST